MTIGPDMGGGPDVFDAGDVFSPKKPSKRAQNIENDYATESEPMKETVGELSWQLDFCDRSLVDRTDMMKYQSERLMDTWRSLVAERRQDEAESIKMEASNLEQHRVSFAQSKMQEGQGIRDQINLYSEIIEMDESYAAKSQKLTRYIK